MYIYSLKISTFCFISTKMSVRTHITLISAWGIRQETIAEAWKTAINFMLLYYWNLLQQADIT